MDMWTSLQNAQLDHIPIPFTLLTHKGLAYGLTRFACQYPFEIKYHEQPIPSYKPARLAAVRNFVLRNFCSLRNRSRSTGMIGHDHRNTHSRKAARSKARNRFADRPNKGNFQHTVHGHKTHCNIEHQPPATCRSGFATAIDAVAKKNLRVLALNLLLRVPKAKKAVGCIHSSQQALM